MGSKWDLQNMDRISATWSKNNKEMVDTMNKLKQELKEKNTTFSQWLAKYVNR